jgi:hypothetical protein
MFDLFRPFAPFDIFSAPLEITAGTGTGQTYDGAITDDVGEFVLTDDAGDFYLTQDA